MDGASRETQITASFVTVADTLTTDYDLVDFLHTLVQTCVEIVEMDAGGIMLVDGEGHLQLMASTSESAELVEIMQLDAAAGPCIDCFHTGVTVSLKDVSTTTLWPAFRAAADRQRFHSALATPMKLRGRIIGTMNLFGLKAEEVSVRDAALVQALADVATIGLLQERVIREAHLMEEQLHRALDSRIYIEQAKGVIAHGLSLSMDDAFALLRQYARDRNLTIRAVSEDVSNRDLTVAEIAAGSRH